MCCCNNVEDACTPPVLNCLIIFIFQDASPPRDVDHHVAELSTSKYELGAMKPLEISIRHKRCKITIRQGLNAL